MKKQMNLMLSLLVFSLGIGCTLTQVSAQTTTENPNEVKFSVKAIIPENQIDKNQTFFDLRVKPKATQDLEVEIFNNAKEDLEVEIFANTAGTNPGGLIEYTKNDVTDPSLTIPFTQIATVQTPKLTIPPVSSKKVAVTVTMPDQVFDGIILGSIYVKKTNPTNQEQTKNSIQIENKFAYVIGVKLTETDVVTEPNFNLKNIEASLNNHRTALAVQLQNDRPAIVKDMKIDATIQKVGSNEVFRQSVQENVEVAPNSNFNYFIDWENQRIEAGKYRLKMVATAQNKRWEWDEEFTIADKKASALNQSAVGIEEQKANWFYIGIGFILLAMVVALLWLLFIRKQKNEQM